MALLKSLAQGSAEAAVEFVPSLLNSVYGLGEALWSVNKNFSSIDKAVDAVHCFASVCYEMGAGFTQLCRNVDWDTVEDCIDEVKKLYTQFDSLNDKEKGELIGFTIGKVYCWKA